MQDLRSVGHVYIWTYVFSWFARAFFHWSLVTCIQWDSGLSILQQEQLILFAISTYQISHLIIMSLDKLSIFRFAQAIIDRLVFQSFDNMTKVWDHIFDDLRDSNIDLSVWIQAIDAVIW